MKLELSNGRTFYVQQKDIKLQQINNKTYIIGNDVLYGVDDTGTKWRLYPTESDTSDMYSLDYYDYVPSSSSYNRWQWVDTNVQIEWESVPPSMKADDTFNFDNFGLNLGFFIFLGIFIIFFIFKRI